MDWGYILASGAGIFSGIKAFDNNINEGERGILLTMGKASRYGKGPLKGKVKVFSPAKFRIRIPFIQRFKKVHVKDNTHSIENLTVTFDDNLSYNFTAFLVYHVEDTPDSIESVLTTLDNAQEYVALHFAAAVQEVMYRQEEQTANLMVSLATKIKRKTADRISKKGFQVEDVAIYDFVETPTSQVLRGVDYKITKALEFKGQMPDIILAAAIGATPTVTSCEEKMEVTHSHLDEDGNYKEIE